MKSIAIMLILVFLTVPYLTVPLPVKAGFRILVVPDDYPTISSAVGNATAGDTIFVKKGTYEEKTLEINKALSLIGEDNNTTVIKLHPPVYNVTWILTQSYAALSNAITVNANDFGLYNLTIVLNPGGYLSITGDRARISGNNMTTGGTETGLVISGSYCNITDNTSSGLDHFDFTNNTYVTTTSAGGFISIKGSSNLIARNMLSKILISGNSNSVGNNTLTGIQLLDSSQNIVSENQILSSTADYGVRIVGNSSNNVIRDNNIQALSCDVEINSSSAENNTFYHNNFILKYHNELARVNSYNSTLVNFWDYDKEGNYWGDYNGTDANRDGIGDTPYVINGDNVDRYPLMEPYDIYTGTIVLPPPELFPTLIVVAAAVTVAVIAIALLVYSRKRNHRAETSFVKKI